MKMKILKTFAIAAKEIPSELLRYKDFEKLLNFLMSLFDEARMGHESYDYGLSSLWVIENLCNSCRFKVVNHVYKDKLDKPALDIIKSL